jgi:hypothetical protein
MINNLGFTAFNLNQPLIPRRTVVRIPALFVPARAASAVSEIGNETFNITEVPGPPGPAGPPGPPGNPGLVPVTIVNHTPYTALLTDYLLDVAVPGPASVILPISPVGNVFIVKDFSGTASSNNITITGLGSLIDGEPSANITTNYGSLEFIFNGFQWSIV